MNSSFFSGTAIDTLDFFVVDIFFIILLINHLDDRGHLGCYIQMAFAVPTFSILFLILLDDDPRSVGLPLAFFASAVILALLLVATAYLIFFHLHLEEFLFFVVELLVLFTNCFQLTLPFKFTKRAYD